MLAYAWFMVKPVTIKVDEALWKKFKAKAKARGVLLTVALEEIFRQAVEGRGAA